MSERAPGNWAQGLNVCVTGFSRTVRDKIRNAVENAGGRYSPTLSRRCTHLIVAPNSCKENSQKLAHALHNRSKWGIRIVSYQWFEECVISGGYFLKSGCEHATDKDFKGAEANKERTISSTEDHSHTIITGRTAPSDGCKSLSVTATNKPVLTLAPTASHNDDAAGLLYSRSLAPLPAAVSDNHEFEVDNTSEPLISCTQLVEDLLQTRQALQAACTVNPRQSGQQDQPQCLPCNSYHIHQEVRADNCFSIPSNCGITAPTWNKSTDNEQQTVLEASNAELSRWAIHTHKSAVLHHDCTAFSVSLKQDADVSPVAAASLESVSFLARQLTQQKLLQEQHVDTTHGFSGCAGSGTGTAQPKLYGHAAQSLTSSTAQQCSTSLCNSYAQQGSSQIPQATFPTLLCASGPPSTIVALPAATARCHTSKREMSKVQSSAFPCVTVTDLPNDAQGPLQLDRAWMPAPAPSDNVGIHPAFPHGAMQPTQVDRLASMLAQLDGASPPGAQLRDAHPNPSHVVPRILQHLSQYQSAQPVGLQAAAHVDILASTLARLGVASAVCSELVDATPTTSHTGHSVHSLPTDASLSPAEPDPHQNTAHAQQGAGVHQPSSTLARLAAATATMTETLATQTSQRSQLPHTPAPPSDVSLSPAPTPAVPQHTVHTRAARVNHLANTSPDPTDLQPTGWHTVRHASKRSNVPRLCTRNVDPPAPVQRCHSASNPPAPSSSAPHSVPVTLPDNTDCNSTPAPTEDTPPHTVRPSLYNCSPLVGRGSGINPTGQGAVCSPLTCTQHEKQNEVPAAGNDTHPVADVLIPSNVPSLAHTPYSVGPLFHDHLHAEDAQSSSNTSAMKTSPAVSVRPTHMTGTPLNRQCVSETSSCSISETEELRQSSGPSCTSRSIASCMVDSGTVAVDQEVQEIVEDGSRSGRGPAGGSVFQGMVALLDPHLSPADLASVAAALSQGGGVQAAPCKQHSSATHVVCYPEAAAKWLPLGVSVVSPQWLLHSAACGQQQRCVALSVDTSKHIPTGAPSSAPARPAAATHLAGEVDSLDVCALRTSREARQHFLQQLTAHTSNTTVASGSHGCALTPCTLLEGLLWCVDDPPERARWDRTARETHQDAGCVLGCEFLPDSEEEEDDGDMMGSALSTHPGDNEADAGYTVGDRLRTHEWEDVVYKASSLTLLFPQDECGDLGHCSRTFLLPRHSLTIQQLVDNIHHFYQELVPLEEQLSILQGAASCRQLVQQHFIDMTPCRRIDLMGSRRNVDGCVRVSKDAAGTIYELQLTC